MLYPGRPDLSKIEEVFFDMVMSLDGFIAPEGMELAHILDPEYKQWTKKWMTLMHWVFQQQFFRENLKIGEGGEIGQENSIAGENLSTYQREHHGKEYVQCWRATLARRGPVPYPPSLS